MAKNIMAKNKCHASAWNVVLAKWSKTYDGSWKEDKMHGQGIDRYTKSFIV
jgi:hypothetical protein